MKTEITPVIFRRFVSGGDIIALFPFEPSDNYGHHCQSYQSIGQHGGASPDLMRTGTVRPGENEYQDLKSELERIGYKLKVMLKFPRNAFDVRKSKLTLPVT